MSALRPQGSRHSPSKASGGREKWDWSPAKPRDGGCWARHEGGPGGTHGHRPSPGTGPCWVQLSVPVAAWDPSGRGRELGTAEPRQVLQLQSRFYNERWLMRLGLTQHCLARKENEGARRSLPSLSANQPPDDGDVFALVCCSDGVTLPGPGALSGCPEGMRT